MPMCTKIVRLAVYGKVDVPVTLPETLAGLDFINTAEGMLRDANKRCELREFLAGLDEVECSAISLTDAPKETERRTALVDVEGQVVMGLDVPKGLSIDEFATRAVEEADKKYGYLLDTVISPKYYFAQDITE